MTESIADLTKRRNLLKEIKALSDSLPNEEGMEALGNYLATLKLIGETDSPDEDEIKECSDHLATLIALQDFPTPNEDEMKEASDHLATLKEIEERSDAA
jgi:hypothetical protein